MADTEMLELPAAQLLHVLANPADFDFKSGVWYAINAPDDFDGVIDPKHTIHGRLGISQPEYKTLLDELKLFRGKDDKWKATIREQPGATGLNIFMEAAALGTRTI
eukprot:5841676-Prymnesium_polylepis.1